MTEDSQTKAPLYQHPKVMLVDLGDEAVAKVRAAGYNVTEGTLGTPFRTQPIPRSIPIPGNGKLPGFMEQEVVVVQMHPPEAVELRQEDIQPVREKTHYWANLESGEFDVRPLLANHAREFSARILSHGGVFVVFCDHERAPQLVRGDANVYGGPVHVKGPLGWSAYDLVPELSGFHFEFDQGEEIRPVELGAFDVLTPFLRNGVFSCAIEAGRRKDAFLPLAFSKYGRAVAGVMRTDGEQMPDGTQSHGWVFLLPQVADIGGCVTDLLEKLLPSLSPRLFPQSEHTSWLYDEQYELPEVRRLQGEIAAVQAEAARQEKDLREAIAREREENAWIHTLLTGTGSDLVDAVAIALGELGLTDVRKVDDEEEDRQAGRRREDIQVWGSSPLLLVEVKGISGFPREHQALQVGKYLIPRMRQWKRNDIRGLSVINHQRGLPALDRENVHVFQKDVLDNSSEQGFGLLTTVDLFRLVRNKRRWNWPDATVTPLFDQDGRIQPIPLHYEEVGVIDGFFEKAGVVTITLTAGLAVGDEVAFRLPIEYLQETVESIHLDDVAITQGQGGQRVGVKTALTRAQARNGVRVYRVLAPAAG